MVSHGTHRKAPGVSREPEATVEEEGGGDGETRNVWRQGGLLDLFQVFLQ